MIPESNGATPNPRKSGFGLAVLVVACLGGCNTGEADPCASDTESYMVEFRFSPSVTEAGNYRVSVESSQVSGSCDLTVGGTSLAPCTSARMTVSGVGTSGQVELDSLRIWYDYAPPTVKLTLERGNTVSFARTFEPNYASDSSGKDMCAPSRLVSFDVAVP